MVEQNSVENVEKKYEQIRIKRDGEIITIKVLKEYNGDNDVDEDLKKYFKSLTDTEEQKLVDSLNNGQSKIFKIVLEDSDTPNFISDRYKDKIAETIPVDQYENCYKTPDSKKCIDDLLRPNAYDILVVKTENILSDDVQTQPIVTQTQPNVAQTESNNATGGTRRRRNNKKNKRKTRNNRKKTNRRR